MFLLHIEFIFVSVTYVKRDSFYFYLFLLFIYLFRFLFAQRTFRPTKGHRLSGLVII